VYTSVSCWWETRWKRVIYTFPEMKKVAKCEEINKDNFHTNKDGVNTLNIFVYFIIFLINNKKKT